MRKILLFLLLITTLYSSELKFHDYDDALAISEKNGKVVMVMLSREGCPACEYMEDVVFKDKNVIKVLNRDFLAVHIDIYKGFVPDDMPHFGTPTFYFVDKNEKKLETFVGGKHAKNFIKILEAVKP